jgi:hypothetical protein
MERQPEPEERRQADEQEPESGMPGGGKGRTETPGRSGVYPVSGPLSPNPQARIHGEASWGQGERGAEGYQDHGESEISGYGGQAGEPEEPAVLQGELPDKRTAQERALTQNVAGNVTEGELPAQRTPEEAAGEQG